MGTQKSRATTVRVWSAGIRGGDGLSVPFQGGWQPSRTMADRHCSEWKRVSATLNYTGEWGGRGIGKANPAGPDRLFSLGNPWLVYYVHPSVTLHPSGHHRPDFGGPHLRGSIQGYAVPSQPPTTSIPWGAPRRLLRGRGSFGVRPHGSGRIRPGSVRGVAGHTRRA